jgi:hypothetical protein
MKRRRKRRRQIHQHQQIQMKNTRLKRFWARKS